MTIKEILEIKERLNSVSPGPWISYVEGRDFTSGTSFIMIGNGNERQEDIEMPGVKIEDQDFIAAARQDIPKLVEEVLRLKKIVGELTD